MTKKTDSELVFTHIQTNPEAFLEALRESPIEQKEAILTYMQSLPEPENNSNSSSQPIALEK